MAFDVNTATPVQQQDVPQQPSSGGFDVNSATTVESKSSVVSIPDKNMNIEHPAEMPDHQVMNAIRDHVYGNDQQPSIPPQGQRGFVGALGNHLYAGYLNDMASMEHVIGADKFQPVKDLINNQKGFASFMESQAQPTDPFKEYAYHLADGVGGLLAKLPVWQVAGEVTAGAMASVIPGAVMKALSFIPKFAIGGAEYGAAEGAEDKSGQGVGKQVLGGLQGGAEGLVWNTLYGNAGVGIKAIPNFIGLNLANTTYDAAKQNRLPTSKELYMSTADGLAYGVTFAMLPHLSARVESPVEKGTLDDIHGAIQDALKDGDHQKATQLVNDIQTNPVITDETKAAVKQVFDNTQSETQDQARKLLGGIETPEAEEAEGKTVNGLKPTGIETPQAKAIEEGQTPKEVKPEPVQEPQAQGLKDESGQVEVGTIPFQKELTETISNAGDMLKAANEKIPFTGKFEDDMYKVYGANGANEVRLQKTLEFMNNQPDLKLTPSKMNSLHQHMDNLDTKLPQDIQLDEKQQQIKDMLEPYQKDAGRIYSKLKLNGIPTDNLHLTRSLSGRGQTNIFEKLKGGFSRVTGSLLGKRANEFNDRVMKSLVNVDTGVRTVAYVKEGENVKGYNNKTETDLGPHNQQTFGELRDADFKSLDNQRAKLMEEYGTLTATGRRIDSSNQRIRNIEKDLVDLENKRQDVIDKYSKYDLSQRVFVPKKFNPISEKFQTNIDKQPKYYVDQASVKEIEQHTDLKYYKQPVIQVMDSWLRMKRIENAVDFLETVKQDPSFKEISAPRTGICPDGWKSTELSQFSMYWMHPKLADAMDSFKTSIWNHGDAFELLSGLNRFVRANMFLNPVRHPLNIGTSWFYGRGASRWFIPQAYGRVVNSMVKALTSVKDMDGDYLNVMKQGGHMMSADVRLKPLRDLMNEQFMQELEGNEKLRDNLSKAVGMKATDMVNAVKTFSEKAAWMSNDFFTLSHIYEREAEGMSREDAIHDASKWIPDYRIPSRVLNQKLIADVMKNGNLTLFSSYHYGILKSLGNGLRVAALRVPMKERAEAFDKLAALAIVGAVNYFVVDNIAKKLTGNPNSSLFKAGPLGPVTNTYDMLKGKLPWQWWAMGMVTPSPMLKSGVELTSNEILGTHKRIFLSGDTAGDTTRALVKYSLSQLVGGQQYLGVSQGKKTPVESLENVAGIKTPHFVANTPAEQLAMNMKFDNESNKRTTDEEDKEAQTKYRLEDEYVKNKDKDVLDQAVKDGQITSNEKAQIIRNSKTPRILSFTHDFNFDQLEKVYDKANPEEQKELHSRIIKSINSEIKNTTNESTVKELIKKRESYKQE